MRKKPNNLGSVTSGFDFSDHQAEIEAEPPVIQKKEESKREPKVTPSSQVVHGDRCYSKYYTPKPKTGVRGGTIGRGPVDPSKRKVQFPVTCTPSEKELFLRAAEADGRRMPDFICHAVKEYIKNHNLDIDLLD